MNQTSVKSEKATSIKQAVGEVFYLFTFYFLLFTIQKDQECPMVAFPPSLDLFSLLLYN